MRSVSRKSSAPLPVLPRAQRERVDDGGRRKLLTAAGDYACNLHSRLPGVIEGMRGALPIAPTSGRPRFADTRLGVDYIFSLTDAGELILEFGLHPDGTVSYRRRALLTMAPGECTAARVGDFLVVRDSTGALHYLFWQYSRQDYVALGDFPRLPAAEVARSGLMPFSGSVAAMRFSKPVADFRPGIPAEVSSPLIRLAATAIEEARELARNSGYWTSPVLVRYAVRLWDGTLLHVSDPVAVAPVDFAQPRRVGVNLVAAAGEYTGTAPGAFTIDGFRLRLRADLSALAGWTDVVSSVEVWVSEDVATSDPAGEGNVAFPSSGSQQKLWITPPQLSESELCTRLLAAGYVRVARISPDSGEADVEISRPAAKREEGVDLFAATSSPLRPIERAEAICGHGGFLHLGGYRRRRTLPSLPSGEPGATQEADCTVTVNINSLSGQTSVSRSGRILADDGVIIPLLWYPDRRACEIVVRLSYPDGRLYERGFTLRPAAGEENAACFPTATLKGTALMPVEELSPVPPDADIEPSSATLVTMARGNPFVEKANTPYAGGLITHIEAQQSGGGAYTRQYLYLFTDSGIVALTHDMEGRHCNCRPISRRRVEGLRRVAVADGYVYALAADGTLLSLRDSSATPLLRGMMADGFLGADDTQARLWIFPEEGAEAATSLVLYTDTAARGGVAAVESTFLAADIVRGSTALLPVVESRRPGERWQVARFGEGGRLMYAEWVSPVIDTAEGGLSRIVLGIEGAETDVAVEVRALSHLEPSASAEGSLLAEFHVGGSCGGETVLPLMLPTPAAWPRMRQCRLRLKVSGIISEIRSFGVESISTQ